MTTSLTTDLAFIQEAAIANEEDNDLFRLFIIRQESSELDDLVHRLNERVSAQIDCTKCGNCCRSLLINVEPEEMVTVAEHLQLGVSEFKQRYVEESQQGQLVINTVPCHFLEDNKCTIYEHRFSQCREFPHLHKTGFAKRMGGTLMHYGSCPIIFNVIEELKASLSFHPE